MVELSDNIHPHCRAFVTVVEDLLARRRQEAAQGVQAQPSWQHDPWGPREWSRTELQDMVYPNYRNMRRGRAVRPPHRETVMDIADYLNCTLEERNRLLVAADAPPVLLYLTGEALQRALQVAIATAQYLPLPAYVINRDWQIHFLNDHVLKLVGVSRSMIEAIAPERRNILDFIMDPSLPVYERLQSNPQNWEYMVRRNIYGFKYENLLCHFEEWYAQQVERLMKLPRFGEYWNEIEIDAPRKWDQSDADPFPHYTTEIRTANDQVVQLRSLLISLGNYDYPQIVAYQPVNAASEQVFSTLGLPNAENGWQAQPQHPARDILSLAEMV